MQWGSFLFRVGEGGLSALLLRCDLVAFVAGLLATTVFFDFLPSTSGGSTASIISVVRSAARSSYHKPNLSPWPCVKGEAWET